MVIAINNISGFGCLVGAVLFSTLAGCQPTAKTSAVDLATAQTALEKAEQLIYLKGAESPATQLAFAETIQLFTSLLDQNPEQADSEKVAALLGRALAYTRTAQNRLALEDVNRALELDPQHPLAHAYRGRVHYLREEFEPALEAFSKAISLDPQCVYALNNRGILWNKQGDWDRAKEDYQAAIAADPSYFKAHYNLGNVYKRTEQWEAAIAAYRKTVEVNPKYTWAHNNLGNLLLQQGRFSEAGNCFEACIRVAPDNADGYRGRGLVYAAIAGTQERAEVMKHGQTARTQAALADFEVALRLAPQDAQTYVGRAQVYDLCGQYEEAGRDLKRALKLQPGFMPAHALLARGLLKRGEYAQARQVYETLATLDSGNPLWQRLAASSEEQLVEFARMVDETERAQAEMASGRRTPEIR